MEQNLPEGFTLEYKEAYTPRVVDSVAAMANTYGGLILVGVTDGVGADRLVGVDPDAVTTQIVSSCHDRIEPPWEPEVVAVPLDSGRSVLVVRVDPARAPRPLLVEGRAPIRLQGRNAWADRSRLADLFSATAASSLLSGWRSQLPQLSTDAEGNPTADFLLSSGLAVPLGERASYRPLSERSIDRVAQALNASALGNRLLSWSSSLGIQGLNPFRRHGFNRARRARLVWEAVPARGHPYPVQSVATVILPEQLGLGGLLLFTVEVTVWARSVMSEQSLASWRLSPRDLYETMESMIAALVSEDIVQALAGAADADPIACHNLWTCTFILALWWPTFSTWTDLKLCPMPDRREVPTFWQTRLWICVC